MQLTIGQFKCAQLPETADVDGETLELGTIEQQGFQLFELANLFGKPFNGVSKQVQLLQFAHFADFSGHDPNLIAVCREKLHACPLAHAAGKGRDFVAGEVERLQLRRLGHVPWKFIEGVVAQVEELQSSQFGNAGAQAAQSISVQVQTPQLGHFGHDRRELVDFIAAQIQFFEGLQTANLLVQRTQRIVAQIQSCDLLDFCEVVGNFLQAHVAELEGAVQGKLGCKFGRILDAVAQQKIEAEVAEAIQILCEHSPVDGLLTPHAAVPIDDRSLSTEMVGMQFFGEVAEEAARRCGFEEFGSPSANLDVACEVGQRQKIRQSKPCIGQSSKNFEAKCHVFLARTSQQLQKICGWVLLPDFFADTHEIGDINPKPEGRLFFQKLPRNMPEPVHPRMRFAQKSAPDRCFHQRTSDISRETLNGFYVVEFPRMRTLIHLLRCIALLFFVEILSWYTTLHAQSPVLDWALSTGATLSDNGHAVVIDDVGNAYCAGYHQQTVDLDPGSAVLTAVGSGIFLQKLDDLGNLLWAVNYPSTGFFQIYDLALDGNQDLLVVGTFTATIDFDPGVGTANLTAQGSNDMFLLKLTSAGNFVFVQQINSGTGSNEIPQAMKVDSQGNILITGWFDGSVDADPGIGTTMLNSAGNNDIFVAKYDANGNLLWAKSIGSPSNDSGWGLTVDAHANVTLVGRFGGTVDFDPGNGVSNLVALGTFDGFVLRLNPNGNFVWAKPLTTNINHSCTVMTLDADTAGNLILGGIFFGSVDLDPGPAMATTLTQGTYDMFLLKTDSMGNFLWGHGIGGNTTDGLYSISTDVDGNIYAGGTFVGTVDFDPGIGTSSETAVSYTDIAVMKFDPAGNFEWVAIAGGSNNDFIEQLRLSPQNALYVTGNYTWTADFAPGPQVHNMTSVAGADAYVYKLKFCPQADTLTLTATTCDEYVLNSVVYDSTGTYFQSFQTNEGCDSVLALHLTVNPLIASVQANVGVLEALPNGASYQWIACDSGNAAIAGANSQSYAPTTAGNFAVVVTLGNCIDTSNCVFLNPVGLPEDKSDGIRMQPNPAAEWVQILSDDDIHRIVIVDGLGRILWNEQGFPTAKTTVDVSRWPRGIYIVGIQTEDRMELLRLILE